MLNNAKKQKGRSSIAENFLLFVTALNRVVILDSCGSAREQFRLNAAVQGLLSATDDFF